MLNYFEIDTYTHLKILSHKIITLTFLEFTTD